MRYHYVWLFWSSAFLLPWAALYWLAPLLRSTMVRVSFATSLFGLTEPLFVPRYWNPPSLFELAQRTRFDMESLVFSFAIGGIGAVLCAALRQTHLVSLTARTRDEPLHRCHRIALGVPVVAFIMLQLLPWNAIYSALLALLLGSIASVLCRPGLVTATLVGGVLFSGLYGAFMLALAWTAPGYIAAVWNLPALSGVLIGTIPPEELVFGFAFGAYWSGVYEHVFWAKSVVHERVAAAA